jgi:hypothetical protein
LYATRYNEAHSVSLTYFADRHSIQDQFGLDRFAMIVPEVLDNRTRFFSLALISLLFIGGCSVAEPRAAANSSSASNVHRAAAVDPDSGALIDIEANGPADTVRAFYRKLREKKFREAIFLTNLRPAIEGLTDAELKEFAIDFEAIAGQVPTEIEINGEIISNNLATVTANLPSLDTDRNEIQTIKLRKENDVWVILTVDPGAEERIRKEGKGYFYSLRIATHEEEARKMLERISSAQLVHSLQNGGAYADLATLVSAGLLPEDVKTSHSTGYNYAIVLATDKRRYTATATPAVYGRSGKLSFFLQLDGKGISRVSSRDIGGKVIVN